MTTSAHRRTKLVGFLGTLALSSVTMLWMLWRFPLGTALVTLAVLSALGVSARLARWVDSDGVPDLEQGERGL
jgi:hypothetical protein